MSRHWISELYDSPASGTNSKLAPLEAALRAHVTPGMTLHFAYNQARAMAISNALVRVFAGTAPGFTIVSAGLVANQAALLSTGLVRRAIVSFAGENYPAPMPNAVIQRAIDSGAVAMENQSLLVISQRLAAGAFGFPFALTRSLGGSSLAHEGCYAQIADPFGSGQQVGAVRALVPDITFVHGIAADIEGNVLLSPPFGEGELAAFAASRGIIASVEQIVTPDIVRRLSHLVKVPSHRVLSVSEAPLGCHPYGLFAPAEAGVAGYVEDYEHFASLHASLATPEAFDAWTQKWILEVRDHFDYVEQLGSERAEALRDRATTEGWQRELDADLPRRVSEVPGHDPIEAMIVAAARVLRTQVQSERYGIVAAGVGFANLAAWLAVADLRREGRAQAELVAEIGLYGYSPRPGEPFIFSNRNIPTCKMLTTCEAILGLHVSGRHNRCLAIIGAGQIDSHGNINSTYDAEGRFLVGSGGANDICSGASEVVAITRQSTRRLVDKLPYVTSIGRSVTTLVTDLGIFEKRAGTFVLTRVLGAAPDAVEQVRARCGWKLQVADSLQREPAPGADELLRLRLYDPRNEFVPRRAELAQP